MVGGKSIANMENPVTELKNIVMGFERKQIYRNKKAELRKLQYELLKFRSEHKHQLDENVNKLIAIMIFLPDFFGEYANAYVEFVSDGEQTACKGNIYPNPFALVLIFLHKHMESKRPDHNLKFNLEHLSQRAYLQLLIIKTLFRDLSITVQDLAKGETVTVYSSDTSTEATNNTNISGPVEAKTTNYLSIFNWRKIVKAPFNFYKWLKDKLYSAYWFINTLGQRYRLRKLKPLFAGNTAADELMSTNILTFTDNAQALADNILNSKQFNKETKAADTSFFREPENRLRSAGEAIRDLYQSSSRP